MQHTGRAVVFDIEDSHSRIDDDALDVEEHFADESAELFLRGKRGAFVPRDNH